MRSLPKVVIFILLTISSASAWRINSLKKAHKQGWQNYVDEQLVGSGLITKAAIIGHDGNTWASSPGWGLKPGEGARIVNLFKNPSDAFAQGIVVNGVKYMGIKAEEESIYGKKGATGVVCVKSLQTILIGIYNETQQPGPAAEAVEKVGAYLRDNGY